MLYAFFVFGGVWFWLLVATEICFLSYFVCEEKGILSTATVIIFTILILCFGDAAILPYIRDNPKVIGMGVVTYFIGAIVYSFIKFYLKLKDIKRKYLKDMKRKYLRDGSYYNIMTFNDMFSNVAFWMAYWPISLFWTFLTDPFYKFFKVIANSISGLYEKMYYSVLGEVLEDVKNKKDSEGNLKPGSFET